MVKLKVKEIVRKYNIENEKIEDVLNKVLHVEDRRVAVYYHHTWGSCREWKFLMMNVNGNYLSGEWIDRSSNTNAHKFKFSNINDLPNVVKIFYYESPSCNSAKKFSFEVIAEVIKD